MSRVKSWRQRAIIAESTLVGVRSYGVEMQGHWWSRTVANGLISVLDKSAEISEELLTELASADASPTEQSH